MRHKVLFILVMTALATASCGSSDDNSKNTVVTAEDETPVTYMQASNYFVRNDSDFTGLGIFKTEEEFGNTFGMAAFMGDNGEPTEIDFDNSFVVAYSPGETNCPTEIKVKSFTDAGDSTLRLETVSHVSEQSTYTMVPLIILILDSKYIGYKLLFHNAQVKEQ